MTSRKFKVDEFGRKYEWKRQYGTYSGYIALDKCGWIPVKKSTINNLPEWAGYKNPTDNQNSKISGPGSKYDRYIDKKPRRKVRRHVELNVNK